ncbi:putative membrane protein [Acidovorax delafieldii]|nr:putative membrane protein [Acidovorax delafieldii]
MKGLAMGYLVLGLVLFLGVHSVRIVADGWRTQTLARMGEMPWKGLYSLVSAVGLVLIVWGYGLARQQPVVLWVPPIGMRHAAALLTLIAFVLLVATYVPRNAIKARLHHPMVLGVKVWALAHVLSNGNLADVLLFGSFLLWAVLSFRAARQRDRAQGTVYAAGSAAGTAAAVVVGAVAWAGFAFWGHAWLIGVAPLGR